MRRLVVAAIVALLALSLFGCGGGGDKAADNEGSTEATQPAAVPTASGIDNPNPIADRSADATESFTPMSELTTMPAEVAEGVANKQAMIIFFYNGDQKVTDDTRKQVEKVAEDNTGLVSLITYNLGKATSIDGEGLITVDPEVLGSDPTVAEAISLAREMKVRGTPFTVVVDDQGYRIFSQKGYIDADLLDRQIERAAR